MSREQGPPPPDDWRRAYWRRNLRLMAVLLVIWFVVSFGCGILFVDQLNEINFFNYPLGFWFAQQGSIYAFVILILVYALRMDRLDKEFGVDEDGDDGVGDGRAGDSPHSGASASVVDGAAAGAHVDEPGDGGEDGGQR